MFSEIISRKKSFCRTFVPQTFEITKSIFLISAFEIAKSILLILLKLLTVVSWNRTLPAKGL